MSGSRDTSKPSTPPMKQHQRVWHKPRIEVIEQELLNSVAGARESARLLAVQSKESEARLNTLPVLSLGLCFDDEFVRIAGGLYLGVPLTVPSHAAYVEAMWMNSPRIA